MSMYGWELEFSNDGDVWSKVGFWASGGFTPIRYEYKVDAERALNQLYPAGFRRVVPATVFVKEGGCACGHNPKV
jgi:hypothetical protein